MKTQYELRFEKLVISLIIYQEAPRYQLEPSLYDFHQNSRKYYEYLCNALYLISVGRSDQSLLLTHTGEPKLIYPHEARDGLIFIENSAIPDFTDDLIDHLELIFSRMKKKLENVSTMCYH